MSILFSFLLFTACLDISPKDIHNIGEKIWENECGKKLENLTHWNVGEDFASMGIGHFVWYPAGKKDRFIETFPDLLLFLEEKGVDLPLWLKKDRHCPWKSREEFYQNSQTPDMVNLRQMLFETKDLQAVFIARMLEKKFPELIKNLSSSDQKKVKAIFRRLAKDPRGLYALIDYLNFKGAGLSPNEAYKGHGWGLLQVLLRIDPASKDLLTDFVQAAKQVLTERIQNAPPERKEERWKVGWFNRLDSYLNY